ncbi:MULTISPECIES: hypothetical protein [unclassified Pseudoalteromonas]|uniref:hypothetical protein n=1 Tax=unclassified Pseudoalteromonas TaxID=194690 RepID=UPI00140848E8|nr:MULTISPECIES: hypothetical protein [unclassified Pseudoalteromonas]MBH0028329.1 hypothetical protein [Pseudoalteromonas sp. SWN29]
MEIEQDSNLTLPLFLLDETLNERDLEQPDFEISISLNDELLAQICQNPSEDSSIAITLSNYQLLISDSIFSNVLEQEHDAQITLTHGPLLSVVLNTSELQTFVSPQMDMMPTFDLGDEDDE